MSAIVHQAHAWSLQANFSVMFWYKIQHKHVYVMLGVSVYIVTQCTANIIANARLQLYLSFDSL